MKEIALTVVILIISSLFAFGQTSEKNRPNIIIILTDDQGYHDVSYYGTQDIETPNIDELCNSGMRFDHFYANSCVCAPSRASILSGRYPEMVGVPGLIRSIPDDNWGYLDTSVVLLPKILKGANYNTAIVGKWNLGLESPNLPNDRGFDYFHGWLDDMMEDYWTHIRNGRNFLRENYKEITPSGHATDLFTNWAIDYINKQKNEKDPFFLYLAYNAPHFPIQPPNDWLKKVRAREPELPIRRAKLVALIEHMDDGIGRVMRALKESGKYENTLIIFLSDNGGHLEDGANNGALRDGKESMYEGGLRVSSFFVWPNHIEPGSISRERSLTMDLLPTITDIVGIQNKHKVDGVSLLPLLTKREERLKNRVVYFTRREGNMRFGGQTIQAVIKGDWKLLQNSPFERYELYNLYDDPQEKRNLININVGKYEELHRLIMGHIRESGSVPWEKAE